MPQTDAAPENPLAKRAEGRDGELREMEELEKELQSTLAGDRLGLETSSFDRNKLLVQTLIFAGIPVAARFLLQHFTGWNGFIDLRDISLLYTGLFFTAGVLFRSILADLKEAEKMPQEFACSLEWVEDIFLFMVRHAEKPDLRQLYRALIRAIVAWKASVLQGADHKQCLELLTDIVRIATIWDAEKRAKFTYNVHGPVDRAKRIACRAAVIRKTDVLPSAHALQQFFVLSSTVVLFVTSYRYWEAQVIIMLVVYTVTWFNLRLLSFVDDPFAAEIPFGMSFLLGKLRQVHFFVLDEYALQCIARHRMWCNTDAVPSPLEVTLALECDKRPFVTQRKAEE